MKELAIHRRPTRAAGSDYLWERRCAYLEGAHWVRWDLCRRGEWAAVLARLDAPRGEVAAKLRAARGVLRMKTIDSPDDLAGVYPTQIKTPGG